MHGIWAYTTLHNMYKEDIHTPVDNVIGSYNIDEPAVHVAIVDDENY